jgi:hypothetical protein
MATTHVFINDFVGLPIIISDFDALPSSSNSTSNNPNLTDRLDSSAQSPPPATDRQTSTSSSSAISLAYSTSSTASALQQNWTTGFSDFADELWAKMTQGMKEKLREACVEVLRKTEDEPAEGRVGLGSWQYDDDARFLD